jgi:hypothetical protein
MMASATALVDDVRSEVRRDHAENRTRFENAYNVAVKAVAQNEFIIKSQDEQKSDLKDIRALLMGIVDKQGRSDGKDDANGKIIKGVLGTGLLGGIVGWIAKHFHLWGI